MTDRRDLPLLWGIFGIDMNVWLDAFLRLQIVVIVMTVTVMALIYLERKFVGRIQSALAPCAPAPSALCSRSPTRSSC